MDKKLEIMTTLEVHLQRGPPAKRSDKEDTKSAGCILFLELDRMKKKSFKSTNFETWSQGRECSRFVS